MSSISSAHDPRAAHCQYSSACARQDIWRIHWSPRKSPRDIFSVFFLGAARIYVSHATSKIVVAARGKKEPPGGRCLLVSAPKGGCIPMIAGLGGQRAV